jgi:hypothetical protein
MRALALTAVAALAFAGAAQAQGLPAGISAACTADYQKLCSKVPPGGGRVLKCIVAHMEEVAETCKSALKAQLEKGPANDAAAAKAAAAKKAAAKNATTSNGAATQSGAVPPKDSANPNSTTAPAGATAPGGAAKQ